MTFEGEQQPEEGEIEEIMKEYGQAPTTKVKRQLNESTYIGYVCTASASQR